MREMLALEDERPNVFVDERNFSEEKVDDGKSVDEDDVMMRVVDEKVGDEVEEEEEEEEEVVFGAKRIDVDATVTKVDDDAERVDENT